MDAPQALSTLHTLDPTFRSMCEALYPGMEPAALADLVYKAEPDADDVHQPSPVWRNGRGHTKGRGRRKLDKDVKETRFVHKAEKKQPSKTAHAVGLATTGVGTGISAVALPKHLKELPTAMRHARTSEQPMSHGIKNAVRAVRDYSKPAQAALPGMEETKAARPGLKALKAGFGVARENPRISAGLLLGATAIHTANLAGEATATHVLHQSGPKAVTVPKQKHPTVQTSKAWVQAQHEIVKAYHAGQISRAEAEALGLATFRELSKVRKKKEPADPYIRALGDKPPVRGAALPVRKDSFGSMGGSPTSGNIKLRALKAPTPVMADKPHFTPSTINAPKPAKSGAGRKAGKPLKKMDAEGEIAKLDADKQQCFGWCSVVKLDGRDVVDKQRDLIEVGDLEESAYDYVLHSRAGGDMHGRADDGGVAQKATLIESMVFTPEKIEKMGLPEDYRHAWWIGLQVHDPDLWDDVKTGKKTKFSIHGQGQRAEVLLND